MVGGLGGWLVSLALDGAGHPVLGLMGIGANLTMLFMLLLIGIFNPNLYHALCVGYAGSHLYLPLPLCVPFAVGFRIVV